MRKLFNKPFHTSGFLLADADHHAGNHELQPEIVLYKKKKHYKSQKPKNTILIVLKMSLDQIQSVTVYLAL